MIVWFQVEICPEKFAIKFKMIDLRPLLTLIWVLSGKLCQIARPLLQNQNVWFHGVKSPEKCQLYLIKKWLTCDHH